MFHAPNAEADIHWSQMMTTTTERTTMTKRRRKMKTKTKTTTTVIRQTHLLSEKMLTWMLQTRTVKTKFRRLVSARIR